MKRLNIIKDHSSTFWILFLILFLGCDGSALENEGVEAIKVELGTQWTFTYKYESDSGFTRGLSYGIVELEVTTIRTLGLEEVTELRGEVIGHDISNYRSSEADTSSFARPVRYEIRTSDDEIRFIGWGGRARGPRFLPSGQTSETYFDGGIDSSGRGDEFFITFSPSRGVTEAGRYVNGNPENWYDLSYTRTDL